MSDVAKKLAETVAAEDVHVVPWTCSVHGEVSILG